MPRSPAPATARTSSTWAATDKNGKRSYFSNYGSRVDVSAPGGDRRYWGGGILSTLNAGKTAPGKADYAEYQGTSMAAPHVAGIVALMKASTRS